MPAPKEDAGSKNLQYRQNDTLIRIALASGCLKENPAGSKLAGEIA
jgi:hypothetical protein